MSKWIAFFLMGVASAQAAEPNAKEIMVHNEEARKVDDVFSNAILTTGGGGSTERVKKFSWWKKLLADKVHYNTMTRFHHPAEVRGEGILFLEHDQNENEVLMYLPNFKKIRRVESQQQSGSFMGSEFSYSDIATPHVEDFQYQLLGEEPCPAGESGVPSEDLKGISCYKVQSIPITESTKERTGYSKSVNWVRKDNFMGVRSEYYDLTGKLWKRMDAAQTKVVDPVKKKWLSHWLRIENLTNGKFTLLQFSAVKANAGIKDATFTQQNLARPD